MSGTAVARVFCRTSMNFAGRGPTPQLAATEVDVHDGRHADLPGWEDCGFQLLDHGSAVASWRDEDVEATHHAEMERLARDLTRCDHALVSSHILRGPEPASRHHDLAPIEFVHSDFAPSYEMLIREMYRRGLHAGSNAALARNGLTARDVIDARRIVILQFWRNIGPARMDFPLGFCDARTVDFGDVTAFTVNDYAGSGIDFEALGMHPPTSDSRHRWYAFPDMEPDEVVAFRTYDSDIANAGGVFFTPHSAFRDPSVPVGHPARQSIELRATCLFK